MLDPYVCSLERAQKSLGNSIRTALYIFLGEVIEVLIDASKDAQPRQLPRV